MSSTKAFSRLATQVTFLTAGAAAAVYYGEEMLNVQEQSHLDMVSELH